MTFRTFGANGLASVVEASCALAQRLAEAVVASPDFELAAPVALNIVCFRLRRHGDASHEDIATVLQEAGRSVLSTTSIAGRRVLRAAFVNHRTGEAHVDAILTDVRWAAARVDERVGGQSGRPWVCGSGGHALRNGSGDSIAGGGIGLQVEVAFLSRLCLPTTSAATGSSVSVGTVRGGSAGLFGGQH